MLAPLALLLMKLPFLSNAKQAVAAPTPAVGTLFRTGVAFYPGQALGGILLFALVPSLAIASCLAKYLYKKTGSVYAVSYTHLDVYKRQVRNQAGGNQP